MLLPKRLIPFFWAFIVLLIQVVLPWLIAKIGPRPGWPDQGYPVWWNHIGLFIVVIGIAIYIWCLVFHYGSYHTSVRLGFSPPGLVTAGPYQISRNPMYLSGLFAWIGWVIYYSNPAVLVMFLLLWSVFNFVVIPREERQLEALFGAGYLEYKRSVRKWIGRY